MLALYIEDITRLRATSFPGSLPLGYIRREPGNEVGLQEDMDFMFEWQEQYLIRVSAANV